MTIFCIREQWCQSTNTVEGSESITPQLRREKYLSTKTKKHKVEENTLSVLHIYIYMKQNERKKESK